MSFKTINLDRSGPIATITFSRPEKRNAISPRFIEELLDALVKLEHDSTKVVVLTGSGQAFCSGMDLDELKSISNRSISENLRDSQTIALLFRTIYEFPKPTIAAVNGAAVAGGCGIATLCDLTIAASSAKFGYPEARIGFVPAIVAAFLVRQIGEKHARELLLTGRIVSAEEAYRLGLVNEVTAPEQLNARVRALAEELLQSSPASLAATKRVLFRFYYEEMNRDLQTAINENASIRATDDFREGIAAFLEKRKPKWKS